VYLAELLRQYNYPTLYLELCTFTSLYGTPLISCWLMLYTEIKGPFSALVLCVIGSEVISGLRMVFCPLEVLPIGWSIQRCP